jgi:hypothetical protein
MKFYVYKITDVITNEYYIGSRKFNGDVNEDKYLGSPHTWKPNIENLIKVIIKSDFRNMTDAILYERMLIVDNINNELNRNYAIPNGRFHRSNLITAINKEGKIISLHKNDPLFGVDFFGVTKGKVLVRDKNNNLLFIHNDDERYLSGEFINNNKFVSPKGENHPNWNKKQINDGVNQKLVSVSELSEYMLSGWVLGTLQKNKRTISSHHNTTWVNKEGINKRISKGDLMCFLDSGWVKGRINLKKYKKRNDKK